MKLLVKKAILKHLNLKIIVKVCMKKRLLVGLKCLKTVV